MNNPGYNPIRRNRNIGSPKAGRGQNNRLVIPASWTDNRLFYEKLVKPVKVCITISSTTLNIFVEPTLSGFAHRYADRFRALHICSGQLPFARIIDENQMISMSLMPEWFSCST